MVISVVVSALSWEPSAFDIVTVELVLSLPVLSPTSKSLFPSSPSVLAALGLAPAASATSASASAGLASSASAPSALASPSLSPSSPPSPSTSPPSSSEPVSSSSVSWSNTASGIIPSSVGCAVSPCGGVCGSGTVAKSKRTPRPRSNSPAALAIVVPPSYTPVKISPAGVMTTS